VPFDGLKRGARVLCLSRRVQNNVRETDAVLQETGHSVVEGKYFKRQCGLVVIRVVSTRTHLLHSTAVEKPGWGVWEEGEVGLCYLPLLSHLSLAPF